MSRDEQDAIAQSGNRQPEKNWASIIHDENEAKRRISNLAAAAKRDGHAETITAQSRAAGVAAANRERAMKAGLLGNPQNRIYVSPEGHSDGKTTIGQRAARMACEKDVSTEKAQQREAAKTHDSSR